MTMSIVVKEMLSILILIVLYAQYNYPLRMFEKKPNFFNLCWIGKYLWCNEKSEVYSTSLFNKSSDCFM